MSLCSRQRRQRGTLHARAAHAWQQACSEGCTGCTGVTADMHGEPVQCVAAAAHHMQCACAAIRTGTERDRNQREDEEVIYNCALSPTREW